MYGSFKCHPEMHDGGPGKGPFITIMGISTHWRLRICLAKMSNIKKYRTMVRALFKPKSLGRRQKKEGLTLYYEGLSHGCQIGAYNVGWIISHCLTVVHPVS